MNATYNPASNLLEMAERAERYGFPVKAQLLRNEAYRIEHPEEFPDLGDESKTRETEVGSFAERGAR